MHLEEITQIENEIDENKGVHGPKSPIVAKQVAYQVVGSGQFAFRVKKSFDADEAKHT